MSEELVFSLLQLSCFLALVAILLINANFPAAFRFDAARRAQTEAKGNEQR